MTKQMEMNYGELCIFFKEEKKRSGKARQLQFKRWRKKYNIEKIEGKNKYIVKRKTQKEMNDYDNKKRNVQSTTLLTPIIYTTLMNFEENVLALTKLEQQRAFSLVNSKFGLESIYHKAIAEEIGVNVKDLRTFTETIWKINNQTINNIINGMIKKGIVLTSKGFKYRDKKTKEWGIADETYGYGAEILAKLNETGLYRCYKINNKNKKNTIKTKVCKVCDFFGFEELYFTDIYYLDKKDIKSELGKMLLSEEDIQKTLIEINTNNCIKISKSRNKNLLNISKYNKEKMISALISETEEECKKNYDAIISNMNDLEIYEENPNKSQSKKKSEKVLDIETSI